MTPESETDESPAAHIGTDVPHVMHSRLMEEAHLRAGLRQFAQVRQEQAAALQRLEGKEFPLAGLLRKVIKKEESPELRAAREEEKILSKAACRMEDISRKIGAEVETLVDVHLAGILPEYVTYRDARRRLQPWEQAVTQFQGKVGKLVDLLGQARNMASSGYDKKRKIISGQAKALIDRSVEAAKAVTKLAEAANEAARNLGPMPEIKIEFQSDELTRLEKMESGPMQAEFDRIITMFERIQKNEVDAVKVSGVGEAETKRRQAASYLADYLEQIRKFSDDRHVIPEKINPILQTLEERYLGH